MSLVNLSIFFDRSDLIYNTGEQITGHVAFKLNTIRNLTCIKLKIKGKAKVKWSDLVTTTDSKGKLQFGRVWRTSDEEYFKTVVPLDQQIGKFELTPGQYLYPFSVTLPPNIPASFVGIHGRIFYYAKVTVMFEKHDNAEKKSYFRVVNLLNLNHYPALRSPTVVERYRRFYQCCCFPAGKISLTASVPRSGFAKNETIPLSLKANNDSFFSIREIFIYVNRKTEWRSGENRKFTIEKLKTINIRALNSNTTRSWVESVQMPLAEFPFIENCQIIRMRYEIQVKVDTENTNCDLDLFIPISIGDIPLTERDPANEEDLPPSYNEVIQGAGTSLGESNHNLSSMSISTICS
ncbi:arrestin domain-containing protein 17-like [Planococcus citri]|uniref:arrestin domain-containing protein 17-like n=1 Tax=Planococcus citri TaxID=170843 RepID=UPI0031F82918